jgi:protein gp37
MGQYSDIEWTDRTWNPVTGCTKISQGCKHCYAERMAKRLQAMGSERYVKGFRVALHPDVIDAPRRWQKPSKVFVNSMSDLFHVRVPDAFIRRVFAMMQECHRHSFQLLTKRSDRLAAMASSLPWPPNLWIGVSVEDNRVVDRIDHLRSVPAPIRFLSCEPLIGPLDDLDLTGISWVIVGGESGPKARPMQPAWVESIKVQCESQRVAFFFKQWGAFGPDGQRRSKKANGRTLHGRTWDEMPHAGGVAP